MPMKTREEYIESLRQMKKQVYMFGEKLDNVVDNPVIRPSLNAIALTYELSHHPEQEELMTATSNLSGNKVNRFTHLHQNTTDLVNKVKMQRMLGQCTGCCFQRCVGMDAFNAVDIITDRMDRELGTQYNMRFRRYLRHVQDEDLVVEIPKYTINMVSEHH